MEYQSKLKLSPVVAGTMSYGKGGKELSARDVSGLIRKTYETGITSFDMADIYGNYTTEALFGEGWKNAGIPREKVQFVTKCGIKAPQDTRPGYTVKHYDTSYDYIVWSADNSLKNIQTDYLDLLLIHRPDPLMNPHEIAEAFHKLRQDGKVLHFGVSNFTPSQFDLLNDVFPLATNQVEISLLHRQPFLDGTLDQCIRKGTRPMAWGPIAAGQFASQPYSEAKEVHQTLQTIAEKHNATPAQILVAWLLRHPSGIYPVMGTTRPERLQEAMEAQKIRLSREEWFALWEVAAGEEVP
ncbi:MAG: aldo/keto reductase [Bacteroidales bacterium]|nr:aldo/keto reductase [Bacteroidales bacterium]MCF8332655.1 aldo/keto reductase [Bacteroidales bacterium]